MFLDKNNDDDQVPSSGSGFAPFIVTVLAIRFIPAIFAWWNRTTTADLQEGNEYPADMKAKAKRLSQRPF
jgi:hypothetical protein